MNATSATRKQQTVIVQAAELWWESVRPFGWTLGQHLAEPTAGIDDPQLQKVAHAVANAIDSVQVDTPKRPSRDPEVQDGEVTCTRCKEPKPVEEFAMRSDRPHRRHTICTPCRAERQSARYLSVAAEQALQEARIAFVVDEVDEVVGLRCSECDAPFRAGEEVAGDVELHHATCSTSD